MNLIIAHGALSYDCKLILVDGKQVSSARGGTAPTCSSARPSKPPSRRSKYFQATMNDRYKTLLATGRRKIARDSGEHIYLVVIDEYAYFSATIGTKAEREKFARSPAT